MARRVERRDVARVALAAGTRRIATGGAAPTAGMDGGLFRRCGLLSLLRPRSRTAPRLVAAHDAHSRLLSGRDRPGVASAVRAERMAAGHALGLYSAAVCRCREDRDHC